MSDIKTDLLVKTALRNGLIAENELEKVMTEFAELRKTTRPQLSLATLLVEKGIIDIARVQEMVAKNSHKTNSISGRLDPLGNIIDKKYEENEAIDADEFDSRPLPVMDDSPGSTQRREKQARFENYRIIQRLGVDAAGSTYQAVYSPDCSRVILRILSLRSILNDPQATDKFLASVKKAHKLDHPGIQKILRVARYSKRLFYVAEYLTGSSLRKVLLEKITLGVSDTLKLAVQACKALAYAHNKGIYHTQLDPSKFIIDNEGHVRLVGFGIGGNVADNLRWLAEALGDMPYYLAPEMATGEANAKLIGACTDIYSLGAVLYHCLTGRPPFKGNSLDEVLLDMYQNENLLGPLQNAPDVSPELANVVMAMLTPEPAKRPSSANDLLKRFQELEKKCNPDTEDAASDIGATARYRVIVGPQRKKKMTPGGIPAARVRTDRVTAAKSPARRRKKHSDDDGASNVMRGVLYVLGAAVAVGLVVLALLYGGNSADLQRQMMEKRQQNRENQMVESLEKAAAAEKAKIQAQETAKKKEAERMERLRRATQALEASQNKPDTKSADKKSK